MCQYTARDSGWGFFSATIKWSDYERVAGILEPNTSLVSYGEPNTKLFGSDLKLHDIYVLEKGKYLDTIHGTNLVINLTSEILSRSH